VTAESLARSLIRQARQRLDLLPYAMKTGAWHIVIREAQECVELALKGLLRSCGLEPPKIHDLGSFLLENRDRVVRERLELKIDRLAEISARLRKERELSFYGDIDFLPDEAYTKAQAEDAIRDAIFCVEQAESALND
jgi:HEPN domain-containing protein